MFGKHTFRGDVGGNFRIVKRSHHSICKRLNYLFPANEMSCLPIAVYPQAKYHSSDAYDVRFGRRNNRQQRATTSTGLAPPVKANYPDLSAP